MQSRRDEFVAFVLEQMAPSGRVRARRMFGGHGIYLDEHFVAIVDEGKLYFKADRTTRSEFEARGMKPLIFKMKNKQIPAQYFEAPPEVFDDVEEMRKWLHLARAAAIEAVRSKRPRSRLVSSARRVR